MPSLPNLRGRTFMASIITAVHLIMDRQTFTIRSMMDSEAIVAVICGGLPWLAGMGSWGLVAILALSTSPPRLSSASSSI